MKAPKDFVSLAKNTEKAKRVYEALSLQNSYGLSEAEHALQNAKYEIARARYSALKNRLENRARELV